MQMKSSSFQQNLKLDDHVYEVIFEIHDQLYSQTHNTSRPV